jgi:hypothetical protein
MPVIDKWKAEWLMTLNALRDRVSLVFENLGFWRFCLKIFVLFGEAKNLQF